METGRPRVNLVKSDQHFQGMGIRQEIVRLIWYSRGESVRVVANERQPARQRHIDRLENWKQQRLAGDPFFMRDGWSESELRDAGFVIVDRTAHHINVWRLRCDVCHLWWRQVSRDHDDDRLLCAGCRKRKLEAMQPHSA